MENRELNHHGVLGMKWGRRRYQNKDGTLTPAGKKRYDKEMAKLKAEEKVLKNKQKAQAKFDKLDSKKKELDELSELVNGPKKSKAEKHDSKPKKKSIDDLTDDELRSVVTRLELEKRYSSLMSEPTSKTQVSKGKGFIANTLETAGKTVATEYLTKLGKKWLGLTDDDSLKKTVEKLNLEKQFKDLTNPTKRRVEDLDLQKRLSELTDTESVDLKKKVNKLMLEKQLKKLEEEN